MPADARTSMSEPWTSTVWQEVVIVTVTYVALAVLLILWLWINPGGARAFTSEDGPG